MGKVKSPEGFPIEISFCKKVFTFYKTEEELQFYKFGNIIIIIGYYFFDPVSYYKVSVCTTSKDRLNVDIASGVGDNIKQAVKKSEEAFKTLFYKIKPLMDK